MDELTGRRRFLQLAGTGTALSIAGCNALQSDGTTTESGSDGSETVTVTVQADQEKLQERQAELRQQLQNDEISQQEARQQSQQIQQELLGEAVESFEGSVEDESALSIDDSVSELGVFLVSGSASALIGALSYDEVGGLLSQETFEQAKAQSGTQTATPAE
ncbi:hypothetical protein [Halorientalis salina]|uniref:hypothetical protein n=1 Tax=Halorientalis salina TaxID=2932266 RepID=UPI0010AB56DF|nr:hypothetical protein [Halorientalis salina]